MVKDDDEWKDDPNKDCSNGEKKSYVELEGEETREMEIKFDGWNLESEHV